MALDVTISLNDARQAELEKLRDEHNVGFPDRPHTTTQQARDILKDYLDLSAARRVDREKLGFRAVYEAASDADKAVMDALRAKYR